MCNGSTWRQDDGRYFLMLTPSLGGLEVFTLDVSFSVFYFTNQIEFLKHIVRDLAKLALFLSFGQDFTINLVKALEGPVYEQQQVLASHGTLLLRFSLLYDNGVLASIKPQTFSK